MSALPKGWTLRRLRFDLDTNPKKSQANLDPVSEVSFVPMDAVGEFGGLNGSLTKEVAEVYDGYTYFADGDVCVAKITPCFENGKGALAEGLTNGVGFGTTELHILRPHGTLDAKFLFYLTIAHDFRQVGASEMLGAGGQKRVPERLIKDWQPPLPSIETQRRIARFLDAKTARIDALITKKRELLERLAEKRQALITQAVTKGLDPNVPMKDSGIDWLGQIPAHWDVKPLRRVLLSIEQGWSPAAYDREATLDEWGILKSGCVNGGQFDPTHKSLPSDVRPVEGLEVKSGDVLMCRASGSLTYIGSVAMVEEVRKQLLFSDKTYRLCLDETKALKLFFIYTMAAKHLRDQIVLSVSGAEGLANNIAQASVRTYVACFPPLSEQREIMNHVGDQLHAIVAVSDKTMVSIDKLTEYRSALITAAVTGQLEIPADGQHDRAEEHLGTLATEVT